MTLASFAGVGNNESACCINEKADNRSRLPRVLVTEVLEVLK
jgi:hypothetical protein